MAVKGRWRTWLAQERTAKFLREVGGVVLGVLIALALGAIATEIGWQVETRGAKNALGPELGELIGQGDERVRLSLCVQRRLDRIADVVERAGVTGRLPPLGAIGNPPYRTWPRGVWDSTISAQTAAHFDREELDNYSTVYAFTDEIERAHARELEVWTTLHALVGPGRVVTAADISALRSAVAEARFFDRFIALNGVRMHQVADAFSLGYEAETVGEYLRPLPGYPICRPIGAAIPRRYGEAPLAGMVERALAEPITRDNAGLGSISRPMR